MKKFLFLGLTALGLALLSEQPAQAWINSKFSVGLNWHWQSGGNSLLWGAFRNGQAPGFGPAFQFQPAPPGGFPGNFPHYGPQEFQYFGQQQHPANPGAVAAPNVPQAPPAAQQSAYAPVNPFQAVNYNPSLYGYPTSGMNYPGYYGYAVPPSYWYGNGR